VEGGRSWIHPRGVSRRRTTDGSSEVINSSFNGHLMIRPSTGRFAQRPMDIQIGVRTTK
jgi:hypothetical protein